MVILRRTVLIAMLALLSCSLIGLLGRFDWFCDLFNSFRPQALIAAFLFLIPALIFRWRTSIAIGTAVILLNGGLITTRMAAFGGAEGPASWKTSSSVRLISANVLASNPQRQKMMDLIALYEPDIVIAVEVTHEWADAFKQLPPKYAHRLTEPRFGVFGAAAYSRLPFTGHVILVGARKLPLLYMDFGSYVVMGVHPPPPVTSELAAEHRVYIAEIADRTARAGKPVVVAGDFNGTLWNDSMRPLAKAGLRYSDISGPVPMLHPPGMAWTWPSSFAPLAMQIDHVFVRGVPVRGFVSLGDIGSDHFPVTAGFVPPPYR